MTNNQNTTQTKTSSEADWPDGLSWDDVMDFFPYDEPRDVQTDGMETALDAASNDGYLLMEGACGTGKTLIALAPFLSLVRNGNSKFERVVVVTSVKQQQRAFEDELRSINEKLASTGRRPVSALTLVGKADVCPYVQQGAIGTGEIYGKCDSLRENTSEMIAGEKGPERSAKSLVSQANREHAGDRDEEPYYVFDSAVPHDDDADIDYCPYYAQHLANKAGDDDGTQPATIPFDLETTGLVTPERLLQLAGEKGTCPHSVMGDALSEVEVVVANYYHLFEPTTVSTFTEALIDDSTLLVVDEAHNLVPRVRDLLNRERTLNAFENAIEETKEVLPLVQFTPEELDELKAAVVESGSLASYSLSGELEEKYEAVQEYTDTGGTIADNPEQFFALADEAMDVMDKMPVSVEQLHAWIDFLEAFNDTVNTVVTRKFKEFDQQGEEPPYEFVVPLRGPEKAGKKDKLSQWMSLYDDEEDVLSLGASIGGAVVKLQSHLRSEVLGQEDLPQFSADGVSEFLDHWRSLDDTRYFRTIEMERRSAMPGETFEYDWQHDYSATLTLFNCIPREEISEQLQSFGAGVMMSATIEPMHVYREVVGLDMLADDGTPVYERRYGLEFPEENRMSFTVDAPAFKYNNKEGAEDRMGQPNTNNRVRETYAQSIFSVVQTTPGNTLVCMPSYTEAWWAGTLLKQHPDIDSKNVHIDESSTNTQTEQMKQEFFDSDNAILVTGALGTLTEGVDYKGDRLGSVVCCGVPIENTNNAYSKAVRTAYEYEFGDDNGFEYAFTVPAVHKTRQALGRVIRSDEDIGVRVLIDERYTRPDTERGRDLNWEKARQMLRDGDSWRKVRNHLHISGKEWDNVYRFLSEDEQDEFQNVDPDSVFNQLRAFWKFHDKL